MLNRIVSPEWLALGQEPALEPDLPLIDAHHHFWRHRANGPVLRYLLDDFLADKNGGHNVVASVYVECGSEYRATGPAHLQAVGESEWVNGFAERCRVGGAATRGVCAAMVGRADLRQGAAVAELLDAHRAAAPGIFRGVRYVAFHDADQPPHLQARQIPQGLLGLPAFRQGFARLAPRGLSFDATVFHSQLPEVAALARAFPGTAIILDHFGSPLGLGRYRDRRDQLFRDWAQGIDDIARCPNVTLKLGGLNMDYCGFGWHERPRPPSSEELATATFDFHRHAIERFSPARCMYETNFPADIYACSYNVQWNTFKRVAARLGLSAAEKAAVFHDTAARVYNIPSSQGKL